MHEEGGEEDGGWTRHARWGVLDRARFHKHMLRQLLSVWQVMVQVLTRHGGNRGEREEGGGEERGVKGVINLCYALAGGGFYM